MRNFILGEVFRPLLRRVGSVAGGYLVGVGVSDDAATTIVAGAVAGLGVALDLFASYLNRRKAR